MAIRLGVLLTITSLIAGQGAWALQSQKADVPKAIVVGQAAQAAIQGSQIPWDLDGSGTSFKMSSGGTSCYAVIVSGGHEVGAFLPHNSATNPDTEAAYSGLARLMGVGGLFQRGIAKPLGAGGVQKLRAMIASAGSMPSSRRSNCNDIMAKTAKNPTSLAGTVKIWDARPYGYDEMVSSNAPRQSHAVMRALQAGNSWPSADQTLSFKGYSARVADLAAGHGVVMMFDALLGQWDRYSGGNVTVAINADTKQFYMYAVDNGGATPSSSSWTSKHVSWMTRYPYEIVKQFADLEAFLDGKTASYAGFKDPLVLVRSVGLVYDYNADSYRKQLLKNLKIIRTKVESTVSNYGERKAYYNLK